MTAVEADPTIAGISLMFMTLYFMIVGCVCMTCPVVSMHLYGPNGSALHFQAEVYCCRYCFLNFRRCAWKVELHHMVLFVVSGLVLFIFQDRSCMLIHAARSCMHDGSYELCGCR